MSNFLTRGVSAAGTGINAALGDVILDPKLANVAGLVRDVAIETLPGDQRTGLDHKFGEGSIKSGLSIRDRGLIDTGIHRHTQKQAGNVRETLAEKGLGVGLRKAGAVFGKRIPAMVGKATTAIGGSGGALALPTAIWAAGDVLDTAAEAITGRGILDHAENPNRISTSNRRKFRHGGI